MSDEGTFLLLLDGIQHGTYSKEIIGIDSYIPYEYALTSQTETATLSCDIRQSFVWKHISWTILFHIIVTRHRQDADYCFKTLERSCSIRGRGAGYWMC